ncbi:Uncharacterised protein [Legionella busanensis]|uniref:Uncharacterized protein n=1 Tax=Legionella busanensis TaxID=190655 RepID=A0A378JLK1_9GAMM|nr:Uncharacterised protein [Legionella busanensis]
MQTPIPFANAHFMLINSFINYNVSPHWIYTSKPFARIKVTKKIKFNNNKMVVNC